MTKKLAAFDVDGTLTFSDSFMLFLRYSTSRYGYFSRILCLVPIFVLYALKLLSRDAAKNYILSAFFKNMPYEKYRSLADDFAKIYPKILRSDGIAAVEMHLKNGEEVALVSASLEDYLFPLAQSLGVKTVLATKMEISNGHLTGRMLGVNCRAQEKLNRIRQEFGNIIICDAYGDSRGDKEMLEVAQNAHYRKLKEAPQNAKDFVRNFYLKR